MGKSIYLLISLYLMATIPVFASGNYESRLAELREIVDTEFALNLPFIKKAQGVRNLKNFLQSGEYQEYFGDDAVIKSVIINDYPYSDQPYTALHEHTLYYRFDGGMDGKLSRTLPKFEIILNGINELEEHLKILFNDKIEFLRKGDTFDKKTSPNFKYRHHLSNFYQILQSNPEIKAKLLTMDKIVIIDSEDILTPTSAQFLKYQDFFNQGQVSDVFILKFKTSLTFEGYVSLESMEFIESLIDITLMHEFSSIFYFNNNDKIEAGVNNLARILTPDNVAILKEGGVKSFNFSARWEEEVNWLEEDGTLTIGFDEHEILTVIDLLFR